MCSPSRSPLPPPSPPAPPRFSHCTRSESLSHASNLGWWSVSSIVFLVAVKWCLIAVLISFSPVVNDVEHLLMCFTGHLCIFFREMSSYPLHVLKLGNLSFYYWVVRVIYNSCWSCNITDSMDMSWHHQLELSLPTWWTWVWESLGSWWWTGKPGMLQPVGSQRVGHDWATEE